MPKGKQLIIVFRMYRDIFTELAGAMLLSLPTSETFTTLTTRTTFCIIFLAIRYFIDDLLYDKPE
jgi:hypothetical protein